MKNIANHIKNNSFKRAYLVYGDEEYLKRTCKRMLKDGISGEDTMNFSCYEGKDMDVDDIVDTSQTMPFFAPNRLILIENSGMFKKNSDRMAEAVKNAPDSTIFVFIENEVDKRNKLYKTVADIGYAVEMTSPKDEELITWIVKKLKKSGKEIKKDTLMYFISRTGNDMDNTNNELDKLISYTGSRIEITMDDIDSVCITVIEDRIFEMVDAIAAKDKKRVMVLYSDLVALREAPMKILAILCKQFATLFAVRDMAEKGFDNAAIAQKLGIRPFFIGKYISQAKKFSLITLRNAMDECVSTEHNIKSGHIEDRYAIELIIMKYSE